MVLSPRRHLQAPLCDGYRGFQSGCAANFVLTALGPFARLPAACTWTTRVTYGPSGGLQHMSPAWQWSLSLTPTSNL